MYGRYIEGGDGMVRYAGAAPRSIWRRAPRVVGVPTERGGKGGAAAFGKRRRAQRRMLAVAPAENFPAVESVVRKEGGLEGERAFLFLRALP